MVITCCILPLFKLKLSQSRKSPHHNSPIQNIAEICYRSYIHKVPVAAESIMNRIIGCGFSYFLGKRYRHASLFGCGLWIMIIFNAGNPGASTAKSSLLEC